MENVCLDEASATSAYTSLYKYNRKNVEDSQQERREKLLREQKENRHKLADRNRQLSELLDLEEPSLAVSKQRPSFKFKLMFSEWFTEVPDDMEENWLVKFAPKGIRTLLVARSGSTRCYSSKGRFYFKIKTNFPGGNPKLTSGLTVLDCFYNKATKTIFILDCLYWNSMSTLDCDANFRFFWLKSKFSESPELGNYLSFNFVLLDFFPAEKSLIQDVMCEVMCINNVNVPYNGVVFYHKEFYYYLGLTPLMGWLTSFMLPEILHIDVSPEHMTKKPKDYVCVQSFLEKTNKKRKKESRAMDVSENI